MDRFEYRDSCKEVMMQPDGPTGLVWQGCQSRTQGLLAFRRAHVDQSAGICRIRCHHWVHWDRFEYRNLCMYVLLQPSGPICRVCPLVRQVKADSGGLLAFRRAHVDQPAGIYRIRRHHKVKMDRFEYRDSCKEVMMQPDGPTGLV